MERLFRSSAASPFHLSIGAIVFNEEGQILVHHFRNLPSKFGNIEDLYLLLKETMKDNETPIETLERGLMEEFGATGIPVRFLGSMAGMMPTPHGNAEKTVLYFSVQYTEHDESRREAGSFESTSDLEWHDPLALIEIMKKQERLGSLLDESGVIKRFMDYGIKTVA